MPRTNAAPRVSVTSRVLSILGCFDAGHRSLTLTEVAQRAGLTLPTAHRLVGELADWGALRRTSHGRYVIGRRLWDLGLLAPVQTDLRNVAAPFLQDLYGATLATVHFAVRDGALALYLDRVSGHASVPVVSKVGARLPLHATGVGKVLLAYAPADVRHEVLASPLQRFTPYTVIQPGRLARQLKRVAQDGYATTTEEMTLGACSIAVPVSVAGRTVASLGIVIPDLRSRARLVPAMQVAVQGIARSLRLDLLPVNGRAGWHPSPRRSYKSLMRTDVAIIGAGPAGLLLAHLLAQDGIESVVVESRTKEYVAARIRAGILESSSVDLLRGVGLGAGIEASGDEHRGIYLQWPTERHHLDFVDLVGRSVWVYGQTQVQADLAAASEAAGRPVFYGASDAALHDLETDHPYVTFTDADGTARRIDAVAVAGCDGSFGPSRASMPDNRRDTWERVYPYSWLGILADVAPSTDELIYAWHPDGFAMHSMRSATVSRLYLQVPNGTDVAQWSDDRIWTALATRLGDGQDGWRLRPGPITDKSVLPMRSFVQSPMRFGRLFLAGDAAHTVPPTGAKGLNLAVADVALLAPALGRLVRKNDTALADAYSDTALRRVWRCEHFSWWMTTMLHISDDPFDAQLQLSQLRWVTSSAAGAAGLAENYAGLPIGF